jgi:hypothetical protein
MSSWPFDQPPSARAVTTRAVLEDAETVRVVVHFEDDGSWAFLCGTTEAVADGRSALMQQLVSLDISLLAVADLPRGWTARRTHLAGPWSRARS